MKPRPGAVETGEVIDPLVTPEDRARYGELLRSLAREPGWRVLVSLIERRKQNLGLAALNDVPNMHKYYRGQRDALDDLLGEVMQLAEEAGAQEEVEPEVTAAFTGRRVPQAAPLDADADDDLGDEELVVSERNED